MLTSYILTGWLLICCVLAQDAAASCGGKCAEELTKCGGESNDNVLPCCNDLDICVRKNRYYAQCLSPERRVAKLQLSDWSGKTLSCDSSGGEDDTGPDIAAGTDPASNSNPAPPRPSPSAEAEEVAAPELETGKEATPELNTDADTEPEPVPEESVTAAATADTEPIPLTEEPVPAPAAAKTKPDTAAKKPVTAAATANPNALPDSISNLVISPDAVSGGAGEASLLPHD